MFNVHDKIWYVGSNKTYYFGKIQTVNEHLNKYQVLIYKNKANGTMYHDYNWVSSCKLIKDENFFISPGDVVTIRNLQDNIPNSTLKGIIDDSKNEKFDYQLYAIGYRNNAELSGGINRNMIIKIKKPTAKDNEKFYKIRKKKNQSKNLKKENRVKLSKSKQITLSTTNDKKLKEFKPQKTKNQITPKDVNKITKSSQTIKDNTIKQNRKETIKKQKLKSKLKLISKSKKCTVKINSNKAKGIINKKLLNVNATKNKTNIRRKHWKKGMYIWVTYKGERKLVLLKYYSTTKRKWRYLWPNDGKFRTRLGWT